MSTRRVMAKLALGTVGLGLAGLTWGLTEAHLFTVRRVEVPVLPAGAGPMRVLHLSDLHMTASQHDKQRFVEGLAELEPDLVIDTGDNFCSQQALGPLLDSLSGLLTRPGAFVFGSNDYTAPGFRNPVSYLVHGRSHIDHEVNDLPTEALRSALVDAGWVDLDDAAGSLEVGGLRIDLRGTDDAHHDRDHYDRVAGPTDPRADLTLGVTHAPYRRVLDAMTADGVDLVMAGHTHGGQVCLPLKGALITNCDLDTARVKGLSTHSAGGRTAWLHVSAGVGTSPFAPYRTFCRPEVTLLTLVAR